MPLFSTTNNTLVSTCNIAAGAARTQQTRHAAHDQPNAVLLCLFPALPTHSFPPATLLQELQELSGRDMLHMTSQTLQKLLPVLNECTEWGQVGRWVGLHALSPCCACLPTQVSGVYQEHPVWLGCPHFFAALCVPLRLSWGCDYMFITRVGQNHIYTVYIRNFWQGNSQIYGHIR